MLVNAEQQHEIEQFYYQEAFLLDEHRYSEWVDLFTEDTHYWMPIRQTKNSDEIEDEFGKPGDVAYYDDPKLSWKRGFAASRPATPGPRTRRPALATSSPTSWSATSTAKS